MRPASRDGVDEGLEDRLLVVADDEDFLDLGDVRDGAEAVLDYGVAGDGEEWLWQCQWDAAGPCNLEISLTLGSSIDSGLNRVPREGPPT
jgi:hypothetical protein